MVNSAIEMRAVRKRYPCFTLGGIDLDMAEGTALGLVGRNGAGKSTLLRILAGLVRADSGTVRVMGHALPAEERAAKAVTAFVSGDTALYGAATLRWHMNLVRDLCPSWDEERAAELAERLHLNPRMPARGMSAGQTAKALLLLAIARRPKVLILDEPMATLDPIARHEVLQLLLDTKREGRALVFSSHYGIDVAALADRVAFLHGGKVRTLAPTAELLRDGKTIEEVFLEHAAVIDRRAA